MNNNNISHNQGGTSVKKKKRKFNIVDFFIALIAVMIIVVLVYAFSPWSQIQKLWNQNEISLQYTVEIRGVDEQFSDLIKKGDQAINSVNKNSLGTVSGIESVEISKVLNYEMDESGVAHGVLLDDPDKFDITVHITATAEYEKGVGYTVNGCRIAVGEELFFRFPQFTCSGYCVAIDTNS